MADYLKWNEYTHQWEKIQDSELTNDERKIADFNSKQLEKSTLKDDKRHWNHGGGLNK